MLHNAKPTRVPTQHHNPVAVYCHYNYIYTIQHNKMGGTSSV